MAGNADGFNDHVTSSSYGGKKAKNGINDNASIHSMELLCCKQIYVERNDNTGGGSSC